jgi:hypothetical protein
MLLVSTVALGVCLLTESFITMSFFLVLNMTFAAAACRLLWHQRRVERSQRAA